MMFTTHPTYTATNMYFTIDSIVIGDVYNQLLRNQLQSSYLPLNYLEYYMFTNGNLAGRPVIRIATDFL